MCLSSVPASSYSRLVLSVPAGMLITTITGGALLFWCEGELTANKRGCTGASEIAWVELLDGRAYKPY